MESWQTQMLGAALAAGVIAIAVTWSIERWGGRVGGLLGTLPSTIIPASLGIYAGGELAEFQRAMDAASAGMLVNALFLWSWRVLPPRLSTGSLSARLALMTVVSLLVWFLLATATVTIGTRLGEAGSTAWLGWGGFATLVAVGLWASWEGGPAPRGTRKVGLGTLIGRGVFAGAAIGMAIFIAQVFGGLAAGVASIFPAMFLTAMLALWLSQGRAVPAGAVGPMMIGSSSVALYAMLARSLMPELGPVFGAALAWTLAVILATLPAWLWLGRRRQVSDS